MGAPAPVVGIVGMRALRRDIAAMSEPSGELTAAMRAAGKQAVEPVAGATRSSLPHVSGTLSGDVRTSGTRTGGNVRMGRVSVPYAGWIEFGGTRDPQGGTRDYVATGRYLFPAARQLASTVAGLYSENVTHAVAAYPWSNETSEGSAVHD